MYTKMLDTIQKGIDLLIYKDEGRNVITEDLQDLVLDLECLWEDELCEEYYKS